MQPIAIGTSVLQRYTKSLDLTCIKGDKITNAVIVELSIDPSHLEARADFWRAHYCHSGARSLQQPLKKFYQCDVVQKDMFRAVGSFFRMAYTSKFVPAARSIFLFYMYCLQSVRRFLKMIASKVLLRVRFCFGVGQLLYLYCSVENTAGDGVETYYTNLHTNLFLRTSSRQLWCCWREMMSSCLIFSF